MRGSGLFGRARRAASRRRQSPGSQPLARRWIGLEAGPLSQWLHAGMSNAELAVELLETRQVRAAFRTMPVKTDKRDACGIAQVRQSPPEPALSGSQASPGRRHSSFRHRMRSTQLTRLSLNHTILIVFCVGAGGRNRTGTGSPPTDFRSAASTLSSCFHNTISRFLCVCVRECVNPGPPATSFCAFTQIRTSC